MTRVVGYVLVSVAVLGALVALLVAEPPRSGASFVDVIQDGVLVTIYKDGNRSGAADSELDITTGERDALDRFVAGLRERSGDVDLDELVADEREVVRTVRLAPVLVLLAVIGLAGGAMLVFGARR